MKERYDFFVSALEEDKDQLLAELNGLKDESNDDAQVYTVASTAFTIEVATVVNYASEAVSQAVIDAITNLNVPDPPNEPQKPINLRP